MVVEPICCPVCQSTDVVRHGKTDAGKQRYKCRNRDCSRHSFILKYSYRGYLADVKEQIIDMAMNGSAEVCLENHSSGQGSCQGSVPEWRIPSGHLPPAQSTLPGRHISGGDIPPENAFTLPHLPWDSRYSASAENQHDNRD